jgi:hypothetical protein
VDLTSINRAKWAEKCLLRGSEGYALDASEAFRTVSEGVFSEVRGQRVLGTSASTFRELVYIWGLRFPPRGNMLPM